MFSDKQIIAFLMEIDARLTRPFPLIVVGGSAASLAYGVSVHTSDIDTFETENFHVIREICRAVHAETGMDIPVSEVTVADAPLNYRERLEENVSLGLKRLKIFFPEYHDLILMKLIRGNEHDIEHIKGISCNCNVSYSILVDRFIHELSHVIGNMNTIRMTFLGVIEELFGNRKADEAEALIQSSGWGAWTM